MTRLRARVFVRRVIIGVMAVVPGSLVADHATAQRPQEVLEVLEAFPEEMKGAWRVGGQTYLANDDTTFDLDHAATIGRLIEVEYIVQPDGTAIATEIEPQSFGPRDISDGPYVFWRDDGSAEIITFCAGEVRRDLRDDIGGSGETLALCNALPDVFVDPTPPSVPQSSWAMPSRLLAVSDLEGNYDTLREFLRTNGVVDADHRWAWGDGHVVFNGDIVDRGHQVTEILWFIRNLQRQAEASGGRVHYVLGNHEAMILAGDLRYIHLKYRFTSGRLGMSYDELFGPSSELGRWFRSCNSLVRVGDLLFVHAGYSPTLDRLQLDMDTINDRVRARLGQRPSSSSRTLEQHLAWHPQGPLWYRGYFDEPGGRYGGPPSDDQIKSILERHDASHIVVGHTVVGDIGWLDENKRLLGIDVDWSDDEEGEGLLVNPDGTLWRITLTGEQLPIGASGRTP